MNRTATTRISAVGLSATSISGTLTSASSTTAPSSITTLESSIGIPMNGCWICCRSEPVLDDQQAGRRRVVEAEVQPVEVGDQALPDVPLDEEGEQLRVPPAQRRRSGRRRGRRAPSSAMLAYRAPLVTRHDPLVDGARDQRRYGELGTPTTAAR